MRKTAVLTLGVFILVGLFLLAVVSIGGFLLYEYYQGSPKVITEFQGVKLGGSLSDATFKLGAPGKDSIGSPNQEGDTFFSRSNEVSVTLQNNKVESVTYTCKLNESDDTSLNGIRCGDNGDKILGRFDRDVRVLCRITDKQDGLKRVYDAVKYGTGYFLTQNVIVAMEIASPEWLNFAREHGWGKCQ